MQEQGLRGYPATAMLRPEQYQFLQVAAPAVPPEELKAAARYQIREMLDMHIDDITLDVLRVGDAQKKSNPQLFVVAAANTVIKEALALADAMGWQTTVIDILETAQRNLQLATPGEAAGQRAYALITLTSDVQAVLTITANDELYYARRLDLPAGFLEMELGSGVVFFDEAPNAFTPVREYVPEYVPDGLESTDYSAEPTPVAQAPAQESDRAQRFLLEVQRTLDSWDRTWTDLPLAGLQVIAAERSQDLAAWLSQGLGQSVTVLDTRRLFTGLEAASPQAQMACLPLLGVALRAGIS
jgi:MSHA biogenesis protein MshI